MLTRKKGTKNNGGLSILWDTQVGKNYIVDQLRGIPPRLSVESNYMRLNCYKPIYIYTPQIPTRVYIHAATSGTFGAHEDDSSSVRCDPERGASRAENRWFRPARLNKICPPPP